MARGHGEAGSAAKAGAVDAGFGGPEDPVGDAAAAAEYEHSRHSGGQQGQQTDDQGGGGGSKGVLLAIAIVLMWLAAFAFFIAFEGTKLLTADSQTTGGGLLQAFLKGVSSKVAASEEANAASEASGTTTGL